MRMQRRQGRAVYGLRGRTYLEHLGLSRGAIALRLEPLCLSKGFLCGSHFSGGPPVLLLLLLSRHRQFELLGLSPRRCLLCDALLLLGLAKGDGELERRRGEQTTERKSSAASAALHSASWVARPTLRSYLAFSKSLSSASSANLLSRSSRTRSSSITTFKSRVEPR
jgi:hypothetical protein